MQGSPGRDGRIEGDRRIERDGRIEGDGRIKGGGDYETGNRKSDKEISGCGGS